MSSGFSGSPALLRGGLVIVDPSSGAIRRVIALQYNPDSVSRTLHAQSPGDGAERSEAMRLRGPAVETFKLDAELDATDQLEFPDKNPDAVQLGLFPQLSALETLIYPSVATLVSNDSATRSGTLEIIPSEAPLTLFVWSAQRVVPVRITELTITEEAFDPTLNPIRAKVSLSLRVLSVDDVGFSERSGSLFLSYLQRKEQLAARAAAGALAALGLGGIG